MSIEDIDWPLVELVDLEVEPTDRYADERYVYPVFSRTPHEMWANSFVEVALFDEWITWDAVRGAVLADAMQIERVAVRLEHITQVANVAFGYFVESIQTVSMGDAARLMEDEAERAAAEGGAWSRLRV